MTEQNDATQADAESQSQADTSNDRESQAESHAETISLDDARKLRSEAANLRKRLKDAESIAQAAETKQREAAEAKAKEEGDYKHLLEEREKELAELRDTLTSRDRDDLRATIARKHNLPEAAVKYLSGDDEDSIEASAKELAKLTARSEDVDTDSGKRTSNTKTTKQPDSLLASYQFGKRR